MKVWPSFKFRFRSFLLGASMFVIIFTVAMAAIFASSVYFGEGSVQFGGYEITAFNVVFVFGIVTIREDLRLGIQNGVSRRSVYFAALLSSVLVTLILAVTGDLLTAAAQTLTSASGRIEVFSLTQLLFDEETIPAASQLRMHMASILMTFPLLLCANLAGSFISLMFYRLNKMWTIIVAVGAPILLFFVLPIILSNLNFDFGSVLGSIVKGPESVAASFALAAIAFAVFNRLLMLRSPIKAAAK